MARRTTVRTRAGRYHRCSPQAHKKYRDESAAGRKRGTGRLDVSIAALPTNLVSLGAPAAERDIERGLEHYFVESDALPEGAQR